MLLRDLLGWCFSVGLLLGLAGAYMGASVNACIVQSMISFLFGLYLGYKHVI